MSEADTRARLRRRLKDLHAKSIENRCEKGMPDMAYIYGWLELKWKRGWPVEKGPVQISHYTVQQRLWLRKHWKLGGRSFLGLVCNKEWLLWAGCDSWNVGHLTREELYQTCLWRSPTFNEAEFRKVITAPRLELDALREQRGLCNLPILRDFSFPGVVAKKTNTKQRRTTAAAIIAMSNVSED